MKKSMAAGILSIILVLCILVPAGLALGVSRWPGAARGDGNVALAAGAPEKIGGGLRTLMRDRDHGLARFMPDLKKILAVMDELGGAKVGISFDRRLSDAELQSLEKGFGIKFSRIDGKLHNRSPIYSAVIPWHNIEAVSRLPSVRQIESYAWPPPIPAMDTSMVEVKANLVWPLTDGYGRPVTGKGVRVATFDTGVDIFHPALWQPNPNEAQHWAWTDTSGNGYFTPGQATVTVTNPQGQIVTVPLRHLDAANAPDNTSAFQPNLDWLYADLDGNGVRDYGTPTNGTPGSNFPEIYKSYGEPIFVANDANNDGLLNWNADVDQREKLIALSVSKVFKTRYYQSGTGLVTRTRGVDLIMTPRDTRGHGTNVAGILAAGVQISGNHSTYTGVAPEPVAVDSGGNLEGGLMVAIGSTDLDYPQFQNWDQLSQNAARIMLYEKGTYHAKFLDGTDDVEIAVTNLANDGIVQIIAAGNGAINPVTGNSSKHFQGTVTSQQPEKNTVFSVPDNSYT